MAIENNQEYKVAQDIENALNDYNWTPTRFAESVGLFHKTLQQSLMRTIVAVIKKFGSEDHNVDSRSRASHELCRKIIDSGILEEISLTMI